VLIICTQTGTVLQAETCVLVNDSDLSAEEWDMFDGISDGQVCEIAKERGKRVIEPTTPQQES